MSDRDSLVDRATEDQSDEQSETSESSDDGDRNQLTQRMPDELLDGVDNFSEDMGMSRNAAINLLVRENLQERNYL